MLTKEQMEDVKTIAAETAKEVAKAVITELHLDEIKAKFHAGKGAGEDGGDGGSTVTVLTGEERIASDPKGGFRSFSEFAQMVYLVGPNGKNTPEPLLRWDNALKVVTKTAGHMAEGDMSQGGYLVPIEFSNQLLMESLEASIVRPRATVIPMGSNSIQIPVVNDASHATSTFGGVIIYRPAEGGQKTASKPTFGRLTLTLHELAGLVYVSNSLLEDSAISLGPLLNQMFGESIAFVEDDDFLTGNGVNRALGAFNAYHQHVGQTSRTVPTQRYLDCQ